MASWDGLDRRKFPRVNYPCLITIRHEHGKPEAFLTHTENIGIGGVCIILNKEISLFAPVELEIDLLDTNPHIKCQGRVVWSVRRKSEEKKKPLFYDMGIEFTDIKADERKRLDEIVSRLAMRQQEPNPLSAKTFEF